MKGIKGLLFAVLLLFSALTLAGPNDGGDDAGNGGFAYKQSVKILKIASAALEEKIKTSRLKDLVDFPERRIILQNTLGYEDLKKLYKKDSYRDGKKLAMDYTLNPPTVIVLKAFYESFAGRTDGEFEVASLEVQKRLLHEASHIWGYREKDAEDFSMRFLKNIGEDGVRPSNDITIDQNLCSCLNGKPDIISNSACVNFCASKPRTSEPMLYINTIMGPETLKKPGLGNLYNWCNTQLESDSGNPQCKIVAEDGQSAVTLDPILVAGSNSLSVNILSLSKNRPWVLKIIEARSGAQTSYFQIFRLKRPMPTVPDDDLGKLGVASIHQYSCIDWGISTSGSISRRNNYAKKYYYFSDSEAPMPMPPVFPGGLASRVCHDEVAYPGNDSIEYPRLDTALFHFKIWDNNDPKFSMSDRGKIRINKIIEERLEYEHNLPNSNLSLFHDLAIPTPKNTLRVMGKVMIPFKDTKTGQTYCPVEGDLSSNASPLFEVLNEYIGNTEGLYLAEKEAEIINEEHSYKTIYGTMLINASLLNNIAFYVVNGQKVRAAPSDWHIKTIYYYWPIDYTIDPLVKGTRKLFTIKSPRQLNEPIQIPDSFINTTDKRIGCIPKEDF